MNMTNILMVFHDANFYSGATHSMIDVISQWDKEKVCVTALFPQTGTAVDFLESQGIECKVISYHLVRRDILSKHIILDTMKGICKNIMDRWSLHKSLMWLNIKQWDYVYSNTGSIYFGYYIAKKLGIKHIWHIREFGIEDQERIQYDGEKGFSRKLNRSEKIIAISKSVSDYLVKKGVLSEKIVIIYNDIVYQPVERPSDNVTPGMIVALSCGGIQRNKGHLLAIKAVKMAVDTGINIKLLIAGNTNTDYYHELKDYVDRNDLNNYVEFVGFVQNMPELRSECQLGIVASYAEAFGRITIEGMLSRNLIIGANSYGTAELIENKRTGILFESQNVLSLYEAIKYYSENPSEVKQIVENAYEYAQKYNQGKAAESIMQLLLEGRE